MYEALDALLNGEVQLCRVWATFPYPEVPYYQRGFTALSRVPKASGIQEGVNNQK